MRVLKKREYTGSLSEEVTARELTNRELSGRAASEGMVLLKNNNLLPLSPKIPVALYGAGAGHTIKGGTGSGDVNSRDSVSVYQGLLDAGYTITNKAWLDSFDEQYILARNSWRDRILDKLEKDTSLNFFDTYAATPFISPEGGDITRTEADIAIYVLSRNAGEGADRNAAAGDYYLSNAEKGQFDDICRLYSRVILLINSGSVVDLSFIDEYDNIDAVLLISQPGMEGGHAAADILSGKVTPSGKLTDSWALRYEDYPNSSTFSHNNGNVKEEVYKEGIYVGYRYFDTFDIPVRYGFGYGLSYTSFTLEPLSTKLQTAGGTSVELTVKVTNTGGSFSGKEVVQVYVTPPAGVLSKEYRRLAAFGKTGLLAPGEAQELRLAFPVSSLASYSEEIPGWVCEAGPYVIWIGDSLQAAVPAAVLNLSGDIILTVTDNICPVQKPFGELRPDSDLMTARLDRLMAQVSEAGLPVLTPDDACIRTDNIYYKTNTELVPVEAAAFTDTLSDDQLIALAFGDPAKDQGVTVCNSMMVPGAAAETGDCCLEKGLASIVLSDGPAGLRLNKYYNVDQGRILRLPFQASLEDGLFSPRGADELPGQRYYQYCTAIPIGTLLAQTWNSELVREVGAMIGGEMVLFNTTLWLAPGMNIHRNPLCGRNFEYYSEDPVLTGRIAAAMTDGVQSVPGCGTTIKHFACNNQEDNRIHSDSILSERALREIYLRGFEIAVKEAQPMAVMTSYNLINGIHSANSYDLCTKVLRNEWGFAGMIMTDWSTTWNGPDCTASGCMRAGNDIVMPGRDSDGDNLRSELAAGTLSRKELKACIARFVNIVWQSNQYENAVPYKKVKTTKCF